MANMTKIEAAFKRAAQWISEGSDASKAGRFVPELAKKENEAKPEKKKRETVSN